MSIDKRLLWIALLLTVAAALWPVPENDIADGVSARPSRGRNRSSIVDVPQQQLRSLTPPAPARERKIVDLFPRQDWTASIADAAAEKPSAPPLPFTYAGRYIEGSNVIVYLNEGATMHKVRQGDTVAATYRIDSIAPAAIKLTYLPLGLRQTLPTGSPISP